MTIKMFKLIKEKWYLLPVVIMLFIVRPFIKKTGEE